MSGRLAVLRSRYAGRPVLMLPRAAEDLAQRLLDIDARAFERPGRLEALFRGLRGAQARRPLAMEDDDGPPLVPFEQRAAYAPLYIGEPDDLGYCWALKDGVALMQADTPLLDRGEDFCGTVYHGYDTLLAGLREAAADDRVKGVFLRMSCPGGVVAGGLAELAAWMRQNRGSAGGKPIHVYADMACSAAYWISAQADKIVAPRVGLVGSIGAVIVHESWAGALQKAGVTITAIQFGKLKTDGAWWEDLSPTARDALQAEIDQCGRDFVADVAAGRAKLTPEALLATEAGVFMAHHDENDRSGLDLGFVDEISGEEAAFSALAAEVSAPQSTGIPSTAASGGRAATNLSKEQPMAVRPDTNPAAAAAVTRAEAALAEAQANLERARAESAAAADPEDAEDQKDGGADEAQEGEAPGEDANEPQDTKKKPSTEASAIAASSEAQAHPKLALSAITSGLTLAQFQAMAGQAQPEAAAGGALDRHIERVGAARRLGPDSAAAQSAPAKIDAGAIYANRQARGRK